MTEIPKEICEAYGELSPRWKLEKLKFFTDIRNSSVDKTISENERPVHLCNYTDVYYNDCITPDLHFMEGSATEAEIERFQLKRGQVILTKDSEDWEDIGVPALVTADMPEVLCSYHLVVFTPKSQLDGGFLAWSCRAASLNDQFKLAANGVTRFGIGQYSMKNAFIALPPLATQRRIARFLDDKTARIDGLIQKKRTLLDLMSEKRQALITCTVTKGLEPGDSMPQDPDREELLDLQTVTPAQRNKKEDNRIVEGSFGKNKSFSLPPSWRLKRLKYLATYNDEVLAESTDKEKEIRYIEISDVSLSYGIGEIDKVSFGQAPSRARRKVKSGDILISTVRTYLRAIATVDGASPDLIASTGFCVVRPSDGVDSGFLGWAAKSELFISEVVARSVGVSYPAINASDLVTIDIPLPTLATQRRIAWFLDEKTTQIDELHGLIVQSIDKLAEYHSALITAAVTGQLPDLQ